MQLAVNLFTGPLGDFEIRTSKKKFQTMILSARFSAFRMRFILCPKDETISMPKSLTLTDSLGNCLDYKQRTFDSKKHSL